MAKPSNPQQGDAESVLPQSGDNTSLPSPQQPQQSTDGNQPQQGTPSPAIKDWAAF